VSRFLDLLDIEAMRDSQGRPLLTRQGRQLWRVLSRFRYQSDVVAAYRKQASVAEPEPSLPGLIETEAGTVTDLCSQPQLTMSLLGEICQDESVPHDEAYRTHCIPRDVADHMLYEACILMGRPQWKADLIYEGVHLFGESHWDPTPTPPVLAAQLAEPA
jgi:hypothetical protein